MFSRRPLTAITFAERQLLHQQWMRSGQCARCFHNSRQARAAADAEEPKAKGNDEGTHVNGRDRHQQTAQQTLSPAANNLLTKGPAKPEHNLPVDSVIDGQDATGLPDVMGANAAPERQGPLAQGISRKTRSIDDELSKPDSKHSIRSPADGAESPLRGGESVLPGLQPQSRSDASAIDSSSPEPTVPHRPGVPFVPRKYSKEMLLEHGYNTATLASGNYSGVLHDRMSTVADVDVTAREKDADDRKILDRLQSRGAVRFASKEHAARVMDAYQLRPGSEGAVMQAAIGPKGREYLVRKVVGGAYTKPVQDAAATQRERTLNRVTNAAILNGTYSERDASRLRELIASMLPQTQAQGQGQAQRQAQRQSKTGGAEQRTGPA